MRGHVAGGALHLVNGNTLVAEKGSTLPPLCLWNGEPCTAGRKTTNFAWAPVWVWIFAVSPLLLLAVYLLARKRGELSYCLGTTAQGRQRQVRWLLGGAVLLGLPLVAIGVSLRLRLLVACAARVVRGRAGRRGAGADAARGAHRRAQRAHQARARRGRGVRAGDGRGEVSSGYGFAAVASGCAGHG